MPPRTGRRKPPNRAGGDGSGALDRDSPVPLFEQLAARIEALVHSGTLVAGERVPSVRKARSQFGVSASTVVEAYRLLEARGVIQSRPQSGSFVRSMSAVDREVPAPSNPPLRCIALDSPEHELASLHAAVPDPSFLPTARLARLLGSVYRDDPDTIARYGSPEGCKELRREIARRMLDAGCTVAPEDVVVTNGATEALSLALAALTRPGDTVAVESPTYHGILGAMQGRGLKALPISACPEEGLCVGAFEDAAKKRNITALVVVPTHSNPLGGTMSEEHKRRLVSVATEHDIAIIEDDVYGELTFEGSRPPALRSFSANVVYCSSFSKVLAPGLRVGWCLPGIHRQRFAELKCASSITSPAGPQLAVARLLAGGGFDRHLRMLRRTYRTQVLRFADRVLASFPDGTRVTRPRGGHVLWVELPPGIDTVELLEAARPRGVTFAPGPYFCPEGGYRNFLRLNCAVPWTDEVSAALATIAVLAGDRI